MQPIMVQIRDRQWTLAALHMACAVAGNFGTHIVLMRMVQVQHLQWLGTELGEENPSWKEYHDQKEYRATAENYGVQFELQTFQYATLPEAISDAADYIDAQIVFATLPDYPFTYWRKFQMWRLRRWLERHQRTLYSLDDVSDLPARAPYILVPATNRKDSK